MSAVGTFDPPGATPPLPMSIWVVAWASLAGQVAVLLARGVRLDGLSVVVSAALGAVVVGYVSAGVVRARTVRLVIAWVVLVLSAVGDLGGLIPGDDVAEAGPPVLSLVTTAAALAGLATFHHTNWYAWQRTRPPSHIGASIGPLVAIGVLVGVLGGFTGPVDDGVDVRITVADR